MDHKENDYFHEFAVAVTGQLGGVVGNVIIKQICDIWGYKSQLEELKDTISRIKSVLIDAGKKWDTLSEQDRHYIKQLKKAVYDADDVFDEFYTRVQLLKQHKELKKDGNFEKVRIFFESENWVDQFFEKVSRCLPCCAEFLSSDRNHVCRAYKISRQVKKIKESLDAIAVDRNKFQLHVDYAHGSISMINRESSSCNAAENIIGREQDKDTIIDMLYSNDEKVFFVSIVGVGGLGKTALAKLVYNDEKLISKFDIKQWVCVSDQDGKIFDVKSILCKILGKPLNNTLCLQSLEDEFKKQFGGKKYFLVLDDIWTEKHQHWLSLKNYLMMGQAGSKVVVTTRSNITASIIGDEDHHSYMLPALSEMDSWRLFESLALSKGPKHNNHDQFVEIGKKIVDKMCYRIPLAIRVVANLLSNNQNISMWQSVEQYTCVNIHEDQNDIFPILKLSFNTLSPTLKSCFIYCAIFPKDFKIKKDTLIALWLAQGYVFPMHKGQNNLEDAAEYNFSILLQRCFFEVVEYDEFGDVEYVKIHDLMHDLAQEIGHDEICSVTSMGNSLGDNIQHVLVQDGLLGNSLCNTKIRSCFYYCAGDIVDAQIKNWMHLRVLDLTDFCIESLPNSIGKLLHLRFLDLSGNMDLKELPDSITRLYNLQTLDVSGCFCLRELPRGISKLVKLRHLNLDYCYGLMCMPPGMDKLTNLRVMSLFVVGCKNTANDNESGDGKLKDLRALHGLKGKLRIIIGHLYSFGEDLNGNNGGGYLEGMTSLRELEIEWKTPYFSQSGSSRSLDEDHSDHNLELNSSMESFINKSSIFSDLWWGQAPLTPPEHEIEFIEESIQHEDMLQYVMKPPRNLNKLVLKGFKSFRIEPLTPPEHEIEFIEESNIQHENMLQYVMKPPRNLKKLVLNGFKGFRIEKEEGDLVVSLQQLVDIHIERCKNLRDMPVLSNISTLKSLTLVDLCSLVNIENGVNTHGASSSNSVTNTPKTFPSLQSLRIMNLPRLKGWWKGESPILFPCLSHLSITFCDSVQKIPKLDLPSLRSLEIIRCPMIMSNFNCPGLENLTLRTWSKKLLITFDNVNLRKLEIDDGSFLMTNFTGLEDLTFSCSRLKDMPKGIQHLTSLQSLYIDTCNNLEGLPKSISKLYRLKSLTVSYCRNFNSLPNEIQYLTSLQYLTLDRLENLCGRLPEWMSRLSSLRSLKITDCSQIESLPKSIRRLTSLTDLDVRGSPHLEKSCKEGGEDFPNIQHITRINIG